MFKEKVNGNQAETFDDKMARIKWFTPEKEPDEVQLKRTSDAFYKSLGLKPLPIRIIRDNWAEAGQLLKNSQDQSIIEQPIMRGPIPNLFYDFTNRKIFQAAQEIIKQDKLDPILDGVYEVINKTMEYSECCIGLSIGNENAKNPFEPLFDNVFGKGFCFLGPINGESIIFVPPIKK